MKPYLRDKVPTGFDDIPDTTSFESGYLVTKMPVGEMLDLL